MSFDLRTSADSHGQPSPAGSIGDVTRIPDDAALAAQMKWTTTPDGRWYRAPFVRVGCGDRNISQGVPDARR